MANRLEIEVGADIKEFQNKLKQSLQALGNFKKENERLKKAFDKGYISQDKYYEAIAKNSIKIANATKLSNKYKNSLTNTDKGMNSFSKGAANGASAMTAFSRTVQDAPFGLMGVSNNITNLTEQFGYLKKRTGSAGGALKAMLNDLKGFGGITLGISLATSAMLIFGDEIKALISDNSAFAKSQKAVNEALNDFYGNSVSKINSYMSILDDVNTSEEQRKNITEELIKVVPSLKKEDFSYGNNLDIVRKKIGAYVLAQASRVEADALVQANSKQLAKQTRIENIKQIEDETKRIQAFRDFLKEEGVRTNRTNITSTYISKGRNTERQATKKEIISDFNNFAKELETELKPIQEKINQLYGDTFSGGLGTSGSGGNKINKRIQSLAPIIGKGLKDLQSLINENQPQIITDNSLLDFQLKARQFKEQLQIFNAETLNILNNAREQGYFDLGSAIGNSIANGGNVIQAAGASLLGTLGGIMVKYGKLAIAFGLTSEALKQAFEKPFGGGIAAVIAGTALVAVGSAIKGFSSNVASGGTGNATAGQGSSFSSGSTFTSGVSSQTNQGMTLVLRGEDMYGAMSAYVGRNKNLGTNLSFG